MLRAICLIIIKIYRLFSPFFTPQCRFYPSCSHYARECFENLPFFRSLWYVLCRICKCHPWHPGGHDPVIRE